jgi:asparaginyl-tRNA synthetase
MQPVGTSVVCRGEVVEPPEGSKQAIEVKVSEVIYVGLCDPTKYPISKGYMTLEKLRENMTFRSRTNACQAVFRVRNALARATHMFFQERGFLYLHAPIITSHDAEGAGEMFGVTTLLAKAEAEVAEPMPTEEDLAVHEGRVTKIEAAITELKAAEKKDTKKIKKEEKGLVKAEVALRDVKCKMASAGGLARKPEDGKIDFSKDFFSRPSYLSVSGQLDAEIYACAMTSVYVALCLLRVCF